MEGVEVGTDDSFKRLVLQKKVKQLGTFESNKKQKKKLNTYIRLIGSVFKTNDPLYYTDVVVVEAAKLVTKYTRYTGDKMLHSRFFFPIRGTDTTESTKATPNLVVLRLERPRLIQLNSTYSSHESMKGFTQSHHVLKELHISGSLAELLLKDISF
ncbi:Hypothetical predicted protein [Prunus dulcis]|uniref:Uncharacterized protein n=1 Tax=Prunus dulcis TaxID=3755 RepID=A0A5E4GCK2_PRUDU|nr:Hypothetical predicted protein [Prunus dulcis]